MSDIEVPCPAPRRLVVLTHHPQAPSFRWRLAPAIEVLRRAGHDVRVHTLPAQRYGWRLWQQRAALRAADLVVLHKLRLPRWELALLRRMVPATVFDVDDAIWLRQPKQVGQSRPPAPRLERRFDGMCAGVTRVIAGNEVLAARARAAGASVIVVPTPVDAAGMPDRIVPRGGAVLVWIGLPGNLQYLEPLRPVLARLRLRHPGLRLRVICSRFPAWEDVPVEAVIWSPAVEQEALLGADIGLMPLQDDPFTRGKCAFKLLQYMAAGLPCVASPVGMNTQVVSEGLTGFLAADAAAWETHLDRLLGDAALRRRMGQAGRRRALADYDLGVIAPRMAAAILGAIEPQGPAGVVPRRGAVPSSRHAEGDQESIRQPAADSLGR